MKNHNSKKKTSTVFSRDLDTEKIAKEFDFSEVEKICARELSFIEKRETVYRLNEFVAVLRAEYGRVIGAEIFLIEDSDAESKKKS